MRMLIAAGLLLVHATSEALAAPRIDLRDLRDPTINEPIHDHNAWHMAEVNDKANNPIERPAHFDVQSYYLDIEVDPLLGTIDGSVAITLKSTVPSLGRIDLDALDMTIRSVTMTKGTDLDYFYNGEVLSVLLDEALVFEDEMTIIVSYRADQPQNLRITGPDATDPNRMVSAYTYTQPLGSRTWFPCLDRPSDKALVAVDVTVAAGYNVLVGGELLELVEEESDTTYSYRMREPVAPYLLSLAVGQYEILSLGRFKDVPLVLWTPDAIRDLAIAETEDTITMMEVFSEFTGVDYPFGIYSQSVAQAWGSSMEHQTATTMGGMRIVGDKSGEGVVAHELAHQWFGDYVTCEIWEELWLNEGFATYMPMVYFTAAGKHSDAFAYYDYWRDGYFSEAQTFVRALSTDSIVPNEMFDSHSYEKGALIINLMRRLANETPAAARYDEEVFTVALRTYLTKHGLGNVRYQDLQAALEEATGQSWQSFFTQWVRSPGHPVLNLAYSQANGVLTIDLEQIQATRSERQWRAFSFPLQVEIITASGQRRVKTLDVYHPTKRFEILVGEEVIGLHADPEWRLPAEITIEQTRDQWLNILEFSPSEKSRLTALRSLTENLEGEAEGRLIDVLARETNTYVLGDALANLSSNVAHRANVAHLAGVLGDLTLDRLAEATLARAEAWLVQTAPDAPTRDDELAWQNRFARVEIQAQRSAILSMLKHADLARAQEFALERLQESHWSTPDQRALVDLLTNEPSATSDAFITDVLSQNVSLYFLDRALTNLYNAKYEAPEKVDLMIAGAKTHRYAWARAAFADLLGVQISSKERVCPVLAELVVGEGTTLSETSYETIRKTAETAAEALGCGAL